jgi:hypothetical protein
MHFLVNEMNASIEQSLIRNLFREERFAELLAEPGELAKRRQRAHEVRSGNIQGTFDEHSGNIQGTFREHSGNIQGTFRNIQEHHSYVCCLPVLLSSCSRVLTCSVRVWTCCSRVLLTWAHVC